MLVDECGQLQGRIGLGLTRNLLRLGSYSRVAVHLVYGRFRSKILVEDYVQDYERLYV